MSEATKTTNRRRWWQRLWTWVKRTGIGFALVLLVYFTIVLVGLIPVNNDFVQTDDGVEIMLISSAVHADLVLPLVHPAMDWRTEFPGKCFSSDTSGATHVMIGWGDAGFYIHTPTWSDLRFSTAANALVWPSESCLHVGMTRDEHIRPHASSVKISDEQYQALAAFILSSFLLNEEGAKQPYSASYGRTDAFFQSAGRYHALNTCNSWIGRAMQSAGIRTPLLTPLPKSAFLYLPKAENR